MSVSSFESLFHAVNDVTPLGVIVLLTTVILLMVHKRGPIRRMQDNHLHHVQIALDRIVEQGDKQIDTLNDIKADIAVVKDRVKR